MHLEELAPAKINLTLSVLGRRPDGYHELDSLVAFASCGDRVTLVPGSDLTVRTQGPFATAITEDNLIAKAARLARSEAPALILGAFTLDKNLPVAAGIGGGSSDAAAALRLLQRANPEMASAIDWSALAARCGADVPVCLRATATRMLGLGERLEPLPPLPPIACVIVNPGVPLATPAVFRALCADRLVPTPTAPLPPLATRGDLLRHLHATGNDLQAPAMSLCPAIADVLDALGRLDGAELVRMSGSGPTCFALFPAFDRAVAAAASLAARRPGWWVVPARLS